MFAPIFFFLMLLFVLRGDDDQSGDNADVCTRKRERERVRIEKGENRENDQCLVNEE